MKTKNALCGLSIAVLLQFGALASSAQTNIYLFSGSETNITLNPGTYIITAYGAPGGYGGGGDYGSIHGGLGAEMSGEFNFSTSTPLTLLVGGGGGDGAGSRVTIGLWWKEMTISLLPPIIHNHEPRSIDHFGFPG